MSGVSTKALRLYEQAGLVTPLRTAAGWRAYGPNEMKRVAEIAALRGLGFSLAQVARVLNGDPDGLEQALAEHQTTLEGQLREVAATVEKVRDLRNRLANGQSPTVSELAHLQAPPAEIVAAFDLPWPWGGERFELRGVKPLTYIVGPLFSGKTRLAQRLAEALPNAAFVGLERRTDGVASPALRSRVDRTLAWLVEDGATPSEALTALLMRLEADGPDALVIDMIEQGLDEATQHALSAHLRRRGAQGRPLFMLTRSCTILDLAAVGPHEAIIFCPANHSSPMLVAAYPGAAGYESVQNCIAPPEVRARTEGVIAWRPLAASAGPADDSLARRPVA